MGIFARFGALLLPLLFAACWENPLTGHPSESINTWLLGQWEHREKNGTTSRAVVLPGASDRYQIRLSWSAKGPRREYSFDAWPSRVGKSLFLTLRAVEGGPNLAAGSHVFVHVQMLDQNTIRLRELQLGSDPSATSMELRREIRARLKDGSLYNENAAQDWKRTGQAYWTRDGETGVFAPLNYEVPASLKNTP